MNRTVCQNCKNVTDPKNYYTCSNKNCNSKFCEHCKFTCMHNSKIKKRNIICPNCVVQYKQCKQCDIHGDYCISCEDHSRCKTISHYYT